MEKWKAVRMLEILSKGLSEATADDMRYLTNNVEPFSEFLYNVATQEFTKDGVDPEKVKSILHPLVEISKMAGANSFADYVHVTNIVDEEE
jgi:hypothetical protein